MALGFAGLVALLWPSLRQWASPATAPAFGPWPRCWPARSAGAVGSVVSRRARLSVNSFVAAAWQMLAAGACSTLLARSSANGRGSM